MLTVSHLKSWIHTYVIPKMLPENVRDFMQWGYEYLLGQDEFPYNAAYEDEPCMVLTAKELVALFSPSTSVVGYLRRREEGRQRFSVHDDASVKVVGNDTFVFSRSRYVLLHNVFCGRGSLEIFRFQTRETRWCYNLLRSLVWEHGAHWETLFDGFMTIFHYVDRHITTFDKNHVAVMTQCEWGFQGDWDALFKIYDDSIRPGRSTRCGRWLQTIIKKRYRGDKGRELEALAPIRLWYLGLHQVLWVWEVRTLYHNERMILLGRSERISRKIRLFWARVC